VPAVSTIVDLQAAAADPPPRLDLAVDARALRRVEDSLEATGLVLLGEVHGILQTPALIAELVDLLDVNLLALEWPAELADVVATWGATGTLRDHPFLWLGDGRITAGHLHLLAQLAARVSAVDVLLFDGPDPRRVDPSTMSSEQLWTDRDHAMAERLAAAVTNRGVRCLVVAGNAHTRLAEGPHGRPMGAWLADDRPVLRSVTVRYGPGTFYNAGSRALGGERRGVTTCRLRPDQHGVLLDVPAPEEAVVPHRIVCPI
jgi:hypothetical protein